MSKKNNLQEFILENIRSGRLKPGEKIFSRTQFMRKFQCARATIDHAIEELIEKKVLDSIKGKGTFVANAKAKKKSDIIYIVTNQFDHSNSMQSIMVESMLKQLIKPAKTKVLTYEAIAEPATWRSCKSGRIVVFVMPNANHNSFLYDCNENGTAFTVLYRDPSEYTYVSIDNRGASSNLVKKLKKSGFKNIGYYGLLEAKYHFPEERYSGFLEGLHECGLPFTKSFSGFSTQKEILINLEKFLKQKNLPEVLICSYINMKDLLIVLEKLKIKPGIDLKLASLNPADHQKYPFELPCMRFVLEEIGQEMGKILETKLREPSYFKQVKIAPRPF